MKRFTLVVLVLAGLPIFSGCADLIKVVAFAPAAFVVASGVGLVRSFRDGKMELKPFEKTSLPDAGKIQLSKRVMAVTPGEFSVELAKSLEAEGLRVITPHKFLGLTGAALPGETNESDYADFAKSAGKKAGADMLFFTSITMENIEGFSLMKIFTGMSAIANSRLAIRLVSSDGEVLWKDEMPFTITATGGKNITEKEINSALASRVIERMKELSLIKPEKNSS